MVRTRTSALAIDKILSELSQLYLDRFKALRTGDHRDIQTITDRIADLKTQLNHL